jgi:ATP-dependent Lon protease
MRDFRDAKTMAQTLRETLSGKVTISHSESLELVSKMFGVADWNTLSAVLKADGPSAGTAVGPRQLVSKYPGIPMRDVVPFPGMVIPLFIGRAKTMQALEQAYAQQGNVALAVQKDSAVDDPAFEDIHEVGALATLLGVERLLDDTMKALVQIQRRVVFRRFVGETGAYQAEVAELDETSATVAPGLMRHVIGRFSAYAAQREISVATWPPLDRTSDAGRLADMIGQQMALPLGDRQALLATFDPLARLARVDALLAAVPLRSAALVAALQRTRGYAAQRRHRYTTLEHLLLGLADERDAAAVMQGCGVDLDALRASLINYLDTGLRGIVVPDGEVKPLPTAGFQRVMQRADAEAKEASQAEVTGANYVVGLFAESESPAAKLLVEQKVTRQEALDFIARAAGH